MFIWLALGHIMLSAAFFLGPYMHQVTDTSMPELEDVTDEGASKSTKRFFYNVNVFAWSDEVIATQGICFVSGWVIVTRCVPES